MSGKPRPRKRDHVVVYMAGVHPLEPRAHTRCLHCQGRLVMELPVELVVWLAANRAFVKAHSSCPKPQRICNPNEKAPHVATLNAEESQC